MGYKIFSLFPLRTATFLSLNLALPFTMVKENGAKTSNNSKMDMRHSGLFIFCKTQEGTTNANADALSRCPITSGLEDNENCIKSWDIATMDVVDISQRQDEDQEIKQLKDYLSDGTLPESLTNKSKIERYASHYMLENDILYHKWTPRVLGNSLRLRKQPVVPASEWGKLLHHFHDELGHPGFFRTCSKMRETYFWVEMKKDVARHVKNCKDCARRKSPKISRPVPLNR